MNKLLEVILNAGRLDVEYLQSLAEDFDVSILEVHDYAKERYGELDINILIDSVFRLALKNNEISEKRVSIHTNCLDSMLYVDGIRIYNSKDLSNCKLLKI